MVGCAASDGSTTLVWHRRRCNCGSCGERFLEDPCAFEGRLTTRLVVLAAVNEHREQVGGAPEGLRRVARRGPRARSGVAPPANG